MPMGRGKTRVISDISIDADIDFSGDYQITNLASPGADEALRKGEKDIGNDEIADDADIAISKLVDDYLPEVLLTVQGDMIVRGASLPERLAKITTDQVLQATATGYQGVALPVAKTIATGSYVGNDGADRQITTGFKCSFVVIFRETTAYRWTLLPNLTIRDYATSENEVTTDALLHASDGFVVDPTKANDATFTYYYWAISE